MRWDELARQSGIPEWPYPIKYGRVKEVKTDVLILGGGIAGCWAAISARRTGAKVVIVEKGATVRSGSGGSGCDHWINTPHPGSPITAEDAVGWELEMTGGYTNALSRYIAARESYDTLLEMEQIGGKIRDTDDEFKGAPFRDEETRFLFAYDYENRYHFRIWGNTFKPALSEECRRLGIWIHDRVMTIGLLTEKTDAGKRITGATGLNTRTGEFVIFKARAVVNCMSRHQRNWRFSTEQRGNNTLRPTQIIGDGHAMAWRAGVEFTMMERSIPTAFASENVLHPYGHGNADNTWVPCNMVDANGKPVPWVDRDGKVLETIEERTRPAKGQKYLGERTLAYEHKAPKQIPDLKERIQKGEFVLPLYADLPSMPEHERNVIWGLMVGQEGKTRIPVYDCYTKAGFDPEKDLLQSYSFLGSDPMRAEVRPQDRSGGEIGDAGGLVTDWNLMTNLGGFFTAGDALFAGNYHNHAAATGRYAGRKAAAYTNSAEKSSPSEEQVDKHKAWAYAPLENNGDIEWKEVNAAMARVMQNYCGEFKNEELLEVGLKALQDIKLHDFPRMHIDTPHKLVRSLEVQNIMTCNEMIIHASLARKASCPVMGFFRTDYPDIDPPEWKKWVTLKQEDGEITVGEMPLDFWKPLNDNYEKYR